MEQPYLFEEIVVKKRKYNPKYGDGRLCKCGHPYYRHFDSHEDWSPALCKYCQCGDFQEKGK